MAMFARIAENVALENVRLVLGPGTERRVEADVVAYGCEITSIFEYLDENLDLVARGHRNLESHENDVWRGELYSEISDEELGNDRIWEEIPGMLLDMLEDEVGALKTNIGF